MSSLSSQPYKGTRDYYPAEKRLQNYIFSVWKSVARRYGYEEYVTPLIEPLEVYQAKSGQELANEQTYAFTDRGERTVAIRPEMTPSVSRLVAARRQELAYPARLFSIANFMRYERPQRGREREFWQLNVDIFGSDGREAEAEIIELGYAVMKEFGATDDMYTIRINNRKVIDAVMHDLLALDAVQAQLMTKLFDRKNKISQEEFETQAAEIFGTGSAKTGMDKLSKLLATTSLEQLAAALDDNDAVKELSDLFGLLEDAGLKNARFDITLMRGLDYYTGTVFEFFDTDPENSRSLFGGGRYDGLVGLFGAELLGAVGMAPGLTMTELFLRAHNLIPDLASTTEAYIVVLTEDLANVKELVRRFRSEDVNIELDFGGRKLDKQIKTAVKKNIPYLIFIGDEELRNKQYNFKDVKSSEEQKLSFERIVSTIKDRRHKGKAESDELFD